MAKNDNLLYTEISLLRSLPGRAAETMKRKQFSKKQGHTPKELFNYSDIGESHSSIINSDNYVIKKTIGTSIIAMAKKLCLVMGVVLGLAWIFITIPLIYKSVVRFIREEVMTWSNKTRIIAAIAFIFANQPIAYSCYAWLFASLLPWVIATTIRERLNKIDAIMVTTDILERKYSKIVIKDIAEYQVSGSMNEVKYHILTIRALSSLLYGETFAKGYVWNDIIFNRNKAAEFFAGNCIKELELLSDVEFKVIRPRLFHMLNQLLNNARLVSLELLDDPVDESRFIELFREPIRAINARSRKLLVVGEAAEHSHEPKDITTRIAGLDHNTRKAMAEIVIGMSDIIPVNESIEEQVVFYAKQKVAKASIAISS